MTTATITRTCPVCGRDYTPQRTDFGRGQFCSVRCANKGNTFAIEPNETKPSRTQKMTDDEKNILLAGGELPTDDRPMRRYLVERLARRRAA